MAALRQSADETVRAPILANRSKVGKVARQIFGQVLSALFVTPNDVPLRIGKIGVFERPTIFLIDVRRRTFLVTCDCWKRRDSRLDESAFQPKNRDEQNERTKDDEEKRQDPSLEEAH